MVITGLDVISEQLPSSLIGKRVGVLCHAPSITKDFIHITDILWQHKECRLSAIFGPQHGIYGQTQDNMIEWQSQHHPIFNIPVFSLYGEHRKPTPEMLSEIDVLLIDLQDIGARLYTYIWTIKLCLEACSESGIHVLLLDRPNPIGRLSMDGPILKKDYFSFVGGASIPLCHRMTIGEMTLWVKENYYPDCDLEIIWMKNWRRNSNFNETGLPWVLPSPNMPTLQTAVVYPGTVLFEALNLSEGRGTTIPFEIFGSPSINSEKLKKNLSGRKVAGCVFRMHDFIPTFNKFSGELCHGLQIHVTDLNLFKPVGTVLEVFDAIIETSDEETLKFNPPPYEYEKHLIPFDILSGDSIMRESLTSRRSTRIERERWNHEIEKFRIEFNNFAFYNE